MEDLQRIKGEFHDWLIQQEGKSPSTAKGYSVAALAWLRGDMSAEDYVAAATSRDGQRLRSAALKMLALWPAYKFDREINLPEYVRKQPEGEDAELLQAFREHLRASGFRESTITAYGAYARTGLQWFRAHPETAQDAFKYRAWLADSTVSTRNDRIKALRRLKTFMEMECPGDPRIPGWLPKVCTSIRKPPVYLSIDEAYKVGQYLRYRSNGMVYAAWALAYGCGLRLREIVHVEIDDIIWGDEGYIRILDTKGGASRDVPIPSQTQAAVRGYIENERWERAKYAPEERRIFMSKRGALWQAEEIKAAMNEAITVVGVRKLHQPMHMWRWLYATHITEQMRSASGAVDWEVLMRLLGHRSLVTTQMYVGEVGVEVLQRTMHMHPMSRPIDEWKKEAEVRRAALSVVEPSGQSQQSGSPSAGSASRETEARSTPALRARPRLRLRLG